MTARENDLMNELELKTAAAARMGAPLREVVRVDDSPAGLVIVMFDGQAYIDVPEDRPDGAGRTGLMYLEKPNPTYQGVFPVFTNPEPDELTAADLDAPPELVPGAPVDDLAGLDKPALVELATSLGIETKANWSLTRLREKIADARELAATPDDDEQPAGDDDEQPAGDQVAADDDDPGVIL